MIRKSKSYLLIVLLVIAVCTSISFILSYATETSWVYSRTHFSRDLQEAAVPDLPATSLLLRHSTSQIEPNPPTTPFPPNKCSPKDHVYFLKTHKCGSSTVQNVLLRRGFDRGLNFVLPERANYLGHPELFDVTRHVGPSLQLPSRFQNFHVLAHHSRYHPINVKLAMPPETVKITILREPAALFESLYNYYALSELYDGLELKSLLNKTVPQIIDIFHQLPRFAYRVGYNQMSFDLGMSRPDFDNPNAVSQWISMVEEDFDLVMISEYMEASLVLLADKMCWPLEDVAFITLNARPEQKRAYLSEQDLNKLHEINNADLQLYQHFLKNFKKRIIQYGVSRMEQDISKLITINQKLMKTCVMLEVAPTGDSRLEYPVISYRLRTNAPDYCKFSVMDELMFTDMLRKHQISRFDKLKKLNQLLNLEEVLPTTERNFLIENEINVKARLK